MLKQLVRSKDGNVATIFALALLPLLGSAGAAIDYARASTDRAKLQNAVDVALIAGANDGSEKWADAAAAAFKGAYGGPATTTFTRDGTGIYVGQAKADVPTAVMSALGIPRMPITVSASAEKGMAASGDACILTLDAGSAASNVSMTFNGAPKVALTGCSIRSNSSMRCNGHNTGAAVAIATGIVNGCGNVEKEGVALLSDTYAGLAKQIEKKCSVYPGVTWSPGARPTTPGLLTVSRSGYTEYHVCGDLTLSGGGILLSETDAVIVVENGSLIIGDRSAIEAPRTAFVLTGDGSRSSEISFPNGNGKAASLTVSPPTRVGHPWRGMSIYQDPVLTKDVDHNWGPGATLNADGVIYLPRSDLRLHGNPSSNNPLCTKLVVNTLVSNGAVNLKQTAQGCAALGVTPSETIVTRLRS